MTYSLQQKPVVGFFLKRKETSPPHFIPNSILLLWTASGPLRFVTLLVSLTPSSPPTSSSTILSLPWAECWGSTVEAKLFTASSIFISQTRCCYCRSSWAPVLRVMVLFAGVCLIYVCLCTHCLPGFVLFWTTVFTWDICRSAFLYVARGMTCMVNEVVMN